MINACWVLIQIPVCLLFLSGWIHTSYQITPSCLHKVHIIYYLVSKLIKLKKIAVLEHDLSFSFLIVFAVNEYFMCLYLHEIMTMYMFVTVFALFLLYVWVYIPDVTWMHFVLFDILSWLYFAQISWECRMLILGIAIRKKSVTVLVVNLSNQVTG